MEKIPPPCTESKPDLGSCSVFETLQVLYAQTASVLSVSGPWEEQARENNTEQEQEQEQLLVMEETVRELLRLLKERGEMVSFAQCGLKEKERLLGLVQDSIRKRFADLVAREEEVKKNIKTVAEEKIKVEQELGVARDLAEKKLLELDVKEKQCVELKRSAEEKFEHLRVKEGMFEKVKQKGYEQMFELKEKRFAQDVKEKEKKFEDQQKCYEQLCKEFDIKTKQFVVDVKEKEKKYEECSRHLKLKETGIDFISKEIGLKQEDLDNQLKEVQLSLKSNEAQWKEIDSDFKKLEKKSEELKSWEMKLNAKYEDLQFKEKKIGDLKTKLFLDKKQFSEQLVELNSREQRFDEQSKELELKEKHVQETLNEIEVTQKKLTGEKDAMELKDKQIEERSHKVEASEEFLRMQLKELELKEKQVEQRSSAVMLDQKQLVDQRRELDSKRMKAEELSKELMLKEKKSVEQAKAIELKEKQIEKRSKAVAFNKKRLEDQRTELASKVKQYEEGSKTIALNQKQLEDQRRELALKDKQIEERSTEVAFNHEQLVDQQRELVSKDKQIEESSKEVALNQKHIEDQRRELASKDKQIEERCKTIALNQKQLEDQRRELASKDKQIEEMSKEVASNHKQLEDQRRELASKDKQIEERCKIVASNQKQLEDQRRELASKDKEIEELSKELASKQKKFEEQFKAVDLKEKQIEEMLTEIASREKKIEDQHKELVLNDTRIKELSKDLESKEEKLVGQLRELALKEKQFEDKICSKEKTEPATDCLPLNNTLCSSNISIQCSFTMNGKELQIFLNKKLNEHDCMQNEVFMALQFSPNPAMLVLNAMEGFYPPHLKNDDMEFDESVVRSTCNLLLKQLMRLSTEIQPDVKAEAIKIASDWITKMKVDVEVLDFLQLVAVYGLADSFDATNLLHYLEVVSQHRQTPKLLRVLGFGNEIKGFIKKLVEKNRQVVAIKFVKEFELTDQHPPVSLLKDYLKHSENNANKTVIDGYGSPAAKNEAISRRIVDLQAVLNCIKDCNLESEYPPEDLRKHILTLKNEYANSQKIPKSVIPKSPAVLPTSSDQIQVLIKSHKYMDAIKRIYEWKVVDKFPPVSLLKDFLLHIKKNADDHCKMMNNSKSSQIAAIVKEIQALQRVIGCIKEYKLEPDYSPTVLKSRMNELKQKQREKQMLLPKERGAPKPNTGSGLQERERCRSPGVACITPSRKIFTTAHNPTPSTTTESTLKQATLPERMQSGINHSAPRKISPQGPTTVVPDRKPENKIGSKRPFSSSTLPEKKKARKESGKKQQQPHKGDFSANRSRYERPGSSTIYYNNEYMVSDPQPYYDDPHMVSDPQPYYYDPHVVFSTYRPYYY